MMPYTRFSSFLNLLTSLCLLILFFKVAIVYHPGEPSYPNHIHKTLFLDRDFDADEQTYIIQAALEWTEATNHVVEFDVYTLPSSKQIEISDSIIINKVNPDNAEILIPDSMNGQTTLGIFNKNSAIDSIDIIAERLDETYYKAVVLHELGHALGLEHNEGIDGMGTLMYPSMNWAAHEITQTDLNNFCHLYHCDIKLKD